MFLGERQTKGGSSRERMVMVSTASEPAGSQSQSQLDGDGGVFAAQLPPKLIRRSFHPGRVQENIALVLPLDSSERFLGGCGGGVNFVFPP